MPDRVQLKREKGWRMPPDTVKVDRTTKWGNPFTVKAAREAGYVGTDRELTELCVSQFYVWQTGGESLSSKPAVGEAIIRKELRGKNLACWCKPGEPCHADVLLEIANG